MITVLLMSTKLKLTGTCTCACLHMYVQLYSSSPPDPCCDTVPAWPGQSRWSDRFSRSGHPPKPHPPVAARKTPFKHMYKIEGLGCCAGYRALSNAIVRAEGFEVTMAQELPRNPFALLQAKPCPFAPLQAKPCHVEPQPMS